jgi:trehalose synthase-fused probable maltokinase
LRDLYSTRPDHPADAGGDFAHEASRLGQMTAELHLAMAGAFGVDKDQFQATGWQAVLAEVEERLRGVIGAAFSGTAEQMLQQLRAAGEPGPAIRVHGDYHLGQVLHAGRDFVIIDFEGEPSRSPTERRIKRGALTDVAGIVRSFQYAAEAGLRDQQARGLVPPDQYTGLAARGRVWQTWVTIAFIGAYLEAADGHPFVPTDPADTHALLTAYVLDKALYEVRYDLNHRPSWAPIPLRGIAAMIEASG